MGAWDYVSTLTLDTSGYSEQINKAITSTKKFKEQSDKTDKALQDLARDGGKTQTAFQKVASAAGVSKEKTLQMGTALQSATKFMGAVGIAVGAAIAAYKGYEKIMNSVGTTQRELEAKQKSYNAVIDSFWIALNQGDITGYLSKMGEIQKAAYEATKQLKLLTLADPTLKLQEKTFEYRKAELERQLKSTTDPQQQQTILNQLQQLVDEYKAFWGTVQNENKKGLDALIKDSRTRLGNFGIGDQVVKTLNGTFVAGRDNRDKITSTTYTNRINEANVAKLIKQYLGDYSKMTEILSANFEAKFRTLQETGKVVKSGYADGYGRWITQNVRVGYNQQAIDEYVAMRTIADMTEEQRNELIRLSDSVQETGIKYENESRSIEDLQREINDKRAQAEKEAADKAKQYQDALIKQIQSQRDELKSLFSKLGKPTSVSGISNYDRQLAAAINALNSTQVKQLKDVYNQFEDNVSKLEQQLSSGDIKTDEYNAQMKTFQNQLYHEVYYIAERLGELIQKVGLPNTDKAQQNAGPIIADIDKRKDESNDVSRLIKEMVGFYNQPAKSFDDIIKDKDMKLMGLHTMRMLNPSGTGVNLVDDYNTLQLSGKSMLEQYDKIGRMIEIMNQSYVRHKGVEDTSKPLENLPLSIDDIYIYNIEKLQAAYDALGIAIDATSEKNEFFKESLNTIGTSASALSTIFGSLAQMTGDSSNKWLQYTSVVLDGISQIMPQISALIGANLANAAAEGTAQAAKVPWPANIGAMLSILATFASVAAQIHSIKSAKYANGGIIDGVTSMGDYNIARVNSGEMILNTTQQGRLFRMLNSGNPDHKDNMTGDVTFKIQGTQLVGVLNNYNKIHNRTR